MTIIGKHIRPLVCSFAMLLIFSGTAFAIEYTDAPPADPQVVDVSVDVSVVAAQKAQEAPVPASVPTASIDDMVDGFLSQNGYKRGWNTGKETYVAVGVSVLDCEDPSYDNSFITKRSLKNMESILDAKAQIIEFVRTDMSVFDQATTPGTDLNAQFKEKLDTLERKVNAQRNKLAKLLSEVDAAEAEALRGATFGDRLNRLMDAAIKKLDETYSVEQIEDKKRQKYEKIKQRYQEASSECEQLEAKLATLTGSKTETLSSKVETFSQMPLMGAIVLAQFEQWDENDEKFRSAVVVIWSKKMEALVRAFISGEDMTVPPGKKTLAEYISSNDWSSSSGSRRFRDNEGNVYFIGIGSAAVGESASSEKRARGIASLNAKKEIAVAVFADVASHQKAEQMMESYNGGTGKDITVAAESFAQELKQSIDNRTISGMQSEYLRKVKHSISGQTIYVSIYAVSSQSARQALLMEESNYLSTLMDIKSQQASQGMKAGRDAAVDDAKRDTTAYQKNKQQYRDDVAAGSKPAGGAPATQQVSTGQGGAYAGGGQDDASW